MTPHELTRDLPSDSPLTTDHVASAGPSDTVGRYRLLECLGEGGMGSVYLAQQDEPVRRRVAVKLIRQGRASAQAIARFEAERQALALMDHPNIAKVFDAGTSSDGQPFFVMEYVRGVPITRFCDDERLTVRARLELLVPVCRAVQHAHQKGIIHRDIKPSNVLVTLADGRPVPKVIDFGVAKAIEQPLTELTMHTQVGTVVGTWEYMSPEQAEASPLGVDTRTDVYSLGVLLYELLTGSTPLKREKLREGGFTEIIRNIREVDPQRPSARLSSIETPAAVAAARRIEPMHRLAHLVRGELDWVVIKALAKNRSERYETPNELGDDVVRYLAGEPVKAVPPSVGYRLKKFLRRNKAAVAAAAAVLLALVIGIAGASWGMVRALDAEGRARIEADKARDEEEKAKTERDRAVAAQDALRLTLTHQVARQMGEDLARLSAVGEALAATVEQAEAWDERQLIVWKERMLDHDPNIYGLCVAFEPDTFDLRPKHHPGRHPVLWGPEDPWRDGYSLYVYRKVEGAKPVAEPLQPKYRYRLRQNWYVDTLSGRRRGWTEPFFDEYGGDIPMVSYVAPLRRRNDPRTVGILAVDLSLTYFQRPWLNDPTFGAGSYGFVMSASGSVIGHPKMDFKLFKALVGDKSMDVRDVFPDPGFRDVVGRILAPGSGSSGVVTGTEPTTKRPARFLYARFKPANWVFVAVVPEVP